MVEILEAEEVMVLAAVRTVVWGVTMVWPEEQLVVTVTVELARTVVVVIAVGAVRTLVIGTVTVWPDGQTVVYLSTVSVT